MSPDETLQALGDVEHPGDSATWTNEAGTVRLVVEVHHDEDASINDYESDGRISHYVSHRDGHDPRPEGFTGRARKLEVDRSGFVWWEPYAEGGWWDGLNVAQQRAEAQRIADLVQSGFVGVSLDRQTKCDQGHWHSEDVASLWGIDSLANGYMREILVDLLSEVSV